MLSSEYYQAIVQLTAQCNQQQLIKEMASSLIDLGLAEQVEYYEFYDAEGNALPEITEAALPAFVIRNVLDDTDNGKPICDFPQIMEATLTQKALGFESASGVSVCNNMLLPVTERNQVVGLILLKGHCISSKNRQYIDFFLQVFSNLISLVWSKERDVLTGLFNRLAFEQRFLNVLKFSVDSQREDSVISGTACLALFDIDHFKLVNDQWGHLIGDEVLLHFSQLMSRSFRYYDLTCRYGGEEFAVALRGVDLATAMLALERFRKVVEEYDFPKIGQKTISIGVSEIRPPELLTSAIERADIALYCAKEHGRNQVCAFERIKNIDEIEIATHDEGEIELF